jgi:Domain of unknown function (DUF1707)
MSEIRASDDERERTVEALRRHAAAGRIDAAELEERLGLALAAGTRGELARIVEDLPAERTHPRPRPVAAPAAARRHRGACGVPGKSPHSMLAIAVLLVAIWAVTGAGYFWPMWPLAWFAFAGLMRWRGNTNVIRYHTSHR